MTEVWTGNDKIVSGIGKLGMQLKGSQSNGLKLMSSLSRSGEEERENQAGLPLACGMQCILLPPPRLLLSAGALPGDSFQLNLICIVGEGRNR